MNKKKMRLEIKEISDTGYFEGLLSSYNNVDQGADTVLPGAYTKTLQEGGDTRPMLWQHKSDIPIGLLTLEDRPEGLWCNGQLLMELAAAKDAYLLIKAKIVKGLSIGFTAIKDEVANGVRKLKEIKLWEGSIVTFPMDENALITMVKSADGRTWEIKGDFNEELTEIQLQDAGYQMRSALSSALSSLIWSGLKKDEIISASETIIEQFATTYMAYIPAYIDMLGARYGDLEMWAKTKFEKKSGREFSAANLKSMKTAHQKITSGNEMAAEGCKDLSALWDDEADEDLLEEVEDTSKSRAAIETKKPEPVVDHSALVDRLLEVTKARTAN